jgi:HlyD family secretion protein
VTFRHRTEDARLEIVEGLPDQAQVVVRIGQGVREGRSVRVSEAGSQ